MSIGMSLSEEPLAHVTVLQQFLVIFYPSPNYYYFRTTAGKN
jgi:hypothetical protein